MSKLKVRVWTCAIIASDLDSQEVFDNPPRMAAINAIEETGGIVLNCNSGWRGKLTKQQEESYVVDDSGVVD